MRISRTTPRNVDEYVAGIPTEVQEILEMQTSATLHAQVSAHPVLEIDRIRQVTRTVSAG